jgi:hypothetical protein
MIDNLESVEAPTLEVSDQREALPVCLAPWLENSYRLVSLWDIMIQFSAELFFWSGYALETLSTDCLLKSGLGQVPWPAVNLLKPVDEGTRAKAYQWLESIGSECAKVGLIVSTETAAEIRNALESERVPTYQWLSEHVKSLRDIIRKEMRSKAFFHITPEKLRFWTTNKNPYPLGEAAHRAFPSAELDAAEAGICLALARPTASVFHSMRVLEVGLSALGSVFGVSLAYTNWGPAIEEIESRVRGMHNDAAWKARPDRKEQQEFYTEERATLIFENIRAFMQQLAARLHE